MSSGISTVCIHLYRVFPHVQYTSNVSWALNGIVQAVEQHRRCSVRRPLVITLVVSKVGRSEVMTDRDPRDRHKTLATL